MKRKSLRQTIALVIIAAILSLSGNFVYADDNFKASSDRALLYDLEEELTAIQSRTQNIELNIENSVIFDDSSDSAALFTSSTSGTCGDGLTWNFDDETQTLTISGNGTMDDYVYTSDIPWYDIRESIVNLLIEDGVTSIGSGAFYNCTSLTDINLSDTVIQIGSMAFFNCTSIVSLNIPNSVKTLGTYVFCNCSNMKSCELSSLLETISEGTFYYCSALSDVSGAENIDVIGTGAFYYCTSLVEYSLPEYVSVIEYAAFCGCTLLETVKINNVLKTIGDGAFYKCEKLKNITFPNSLTSIGDNAFEYCAIETLELPDGIVSIEQETFRYCENLTSVTMTDSVTEIHAYAFAQCSNLEDVSLSDNLSVIGDCAFFNCDSLTYIEFPDSLKTIGYSSFFGTGLTEFTIPDGVETIQSAAFAGCSDLKSVVISDSVTSIGDLTFMRDTKLCDVKLSDNIDTIGVGAFVWCNNLDSMEIPDNVTVIDVCAFQECSALTKITLPEAITTIAKNAFLDSDNLCDIYYEGDESMWKTIDIDSENDFLDDAEVIYLFGTDNTVNIAKEDVMGGVKITLSTEESSVIYYTLNGDEPCSNSTVYEAPFTITTAGDYTIRAMAEYNKSEYSEISELHMTIEQLTTPTIIAGDSGITISGAENASIYYCTEMRKPTTQDALYVNTISVDDITYISAVCVKAGYASSKTAYWYENRKTEYGLLMDAFSFKNEKKQFFGGSNLALQDISDRFTDVFGTTKGRLLSDEYGEYWTGSCFGMAVTSLLFNKQYLDTDTYLENENSVYELSAPRSKDKALSKLILNYQVSQFSENIMDSKSSNKIQTRYSNGDISEICSAVMNLEDEPILLSVWSDTLDKNNPQEHALLPYYAEYAENGIYYVYVYDCNLPPQNEDDIHILTLNESDNTFIYYDDTNFITYDYSISFISLKEYFEELYGDDDVALFESVDADEKFILSLNSNDVTVYNSDGIEANDINEAVLYSANDFDLDNITTWLLPSGTYTIINNDTSLEDFRISTASNDDYYSISFSDSAVTAEIGVSAVTDRLYCCGQSYESSDIEITAYNSDKKENSLTLTSDYAYITSCNDKSIMLSTNSEYAYINGNYIQLSGNIDDTDYGSGSYLVSAAPKFLNNETHNCEISVLSEPKVLGNNITGTLKLRISNNGNISETGNLIICLYDGTGTAVDVEMYKNICIDTNVYVTESFDMEIYGLDSDVEYMMKIFFWNDNQIPLSNAAELYY